MNVHTPLDIPLLQRAVVLRLSGHLSGSTPAQITQLLSDMQPAPADADLLVIDLRKVDTLPAVWARALCGLATSSAHGLGCQLVVTVDSAIARCLDAADPTGRVPRFSNLDDAFGVRTGSSNAGPLSVGARQERVASTGQLAEFEAQFETLTRTLLTSDSVGAALRQVVDAAVLVVPGADMVSVTLRGPDGEFFTPVHTDAAAAELDQVQYQDGQGPCVDASDPESPGYVVSGDLAVEDRWPRFGATAACYGYRAVLSTELFFPREVRRLSGALNIYSRRRGGFATADRHAALLLATHASLALAHTQAVADADLRQAQWRRAVDTRDVIGQAKGILMNRQHITADEAFTLLRRTSQDLNVKLVDLARTLADRHTELGPS